MNRRTFLKSVAFSTVVAGFALATTSPLQSLAEALFFPTVQLELPGRVLRGTWDGRLLESRNAGKTWQQLANFGSHCSVQALVARQGTIYARVGIQRYSFALQSVDGRTWMTSSAFPA